MKMNAKKLTLALVALLLALTCVFVACKKEPEKPVDDKPADQPAAPEAVDLTGVAENFKTDYKANYLSLYTDDVATALAALRAEALLKIANAKSVDDAKKIAAEYIAELKAARTLVDEVKDLIAKIAVDGNLKHENAEDGVALADGKDIALMSAYNARIEATFVTAAGAQKDVTDAYKAEQLPTVKAIEARLRALKVADLAANAKGGLNDQIDAMLDKVDKAVEYKLDGEYEKDATKLVLRDYEDLLILEAQFDTFVEMHKLVKGTEAYAEILHGTQLDSAIAGFEAKTKEHEQIVRARALINAAKELAAAARAAARYDGDEEELVLVNAENPTSAAAATAPVYFIAADIYNRAKGGAIPDDSIVNPIKIEGLWDETGAIEEPKSVWVSMNDIYADLTEAWTALNTLQIMEVTISGDPGSKNPFRVWIPNSDELSHYILDEDLQAAAEAALAAANDWNALLDLGGYNELEETIAHTFYREIIVELLDQYNTSLFTALASYYVFAANLVEMNYVDEFPVKGVQYDEYLLTTDTQTVTEAGVQQWKANLLNEIAKLQKDAKTDYTTETALIRRLFTTFGADYHDYEAFADFLTGRDTTYKVDLHDNGDGTFTPSIFYQVFAFLWKVDNLAKDDKVVVDDENTDILANVIKNVNDYFFNGGKPDYHTNVNYYDLAVKMKAWVEKYIETIPEDVFDLEPFKFVINVNEPAGFGAVKLTFADEKLEEVAIPQITELNGEKVNATPSEALDITVYADYNVALAAIAEYDRLVAELKATAAALKEDVRTLFVVGDADFIVNLRNAYYAAMAKYATCVVDDTNNTADDELNSLLEELKRIDEFNYDRYALIVDTAKGLQDRALALYPHKEWNDALATLKADVAAAQAEYDEMTLAIRAFDQVLAEAQEYLAYCEAGHTIGWANTKTVTKTFRITRDLGNGQYESYDEERTVVVVDEEVRLVSDDQLAEAQQWVDVLTKWRFILTDATMFIIENDSRVDYAQHVQTPDVPADPATLYDFDDEDLYDALTSIVCNDEPPYYYYYESAIRYLPATVRVEVLDENGEAVVDENGEVVKVTVELVNYMINILRDAKQSVKYELGNTADSVYVIIARANLDEIALKKALDDATKAYNDATAEFAANFKIKANKAYKDIVELVDLIEDMDYFTKHAIITAKTPTVEYADYDYLNLSVTNDYTGNAIDLFSQVFNERIMASYYRAILLTREFAINVFEDLKLDGAQEAVIAAATADARAALMDDAKAYALGIAQDALDVAAREAVIDHVTELAVAAAIEDPEVDATDADAVAAFVEDYLNNYLATYMAQWIAVHGEEFIDDYLAQHEDDLIEEYFAEGGRLNEKILALLEEDLRKYVEEYLANGFADALDAFLEVFDAEWFDYSKNELLKVESTKTYTKIADGKADVVEAWRFINVNWEFVETFLNTVFHNNVNYYDAVISYLKNPYIHATYTVGEDEDEYEALLVDFEINVNLKGSQTNPTVIIRDCVEIDENEALSDDLKTFTFLNYVIHTTRRSGVLVSIDGFTIALVDYYPIPFYPAYVD